MHAQALHAFPAACRYFVGITLMAHIPDQPVFRGIEDGVQGDGQFYGAEIGGQMTAGLRYRLNQEGAQFADQLWQLLAFQTTQVGWAIDGVKQFECTHLELPMADEIG